MFKIEEMDIYKTTDRFLNNYKHLKKSLKRDPTLEEISKYLLSIETKFITNSLIVSIMYSY